MPAPTTFDNETRDPASFRDPKGFVFHANGRIRRAVTAFGVEDARAVRATGLIDRLIERGLLLPEEEIATSLDGRPDVRLVLEHPKLPFVSYPYEWSFLALQAAALMHLDIQIEALDAGVMLTDASAYNVQFVGARPVFIDHLSFRPYRDGELWAAHRQFCEQFVHPLVLRGLLGIEFQPWYRGRPAGIVGRDVSRLLRFHHKLRWNVLVNIVLPARLQRLADRRSMGARVQKGRLSRPALREMFTSMRGWIARMRPRGLDSRWADYESTVPAEEEQFVSEFVARFVDQVRPRMLWDLGCNAGRYSETALRAGVEYVVGLDYDAGAVNNAFARARDANLRLLPLFVDLLNPTPSQGWRERERESLLGRTSADGVMAIAVVHHLAMAGNAPLEEIVSMLTGLAADGVIGFVPSTDPRARDLFAGREEMFRSYTLDNFLALLRARARVVRQVTIPGSDRTLLWFSTR